MDHYIDIHLRPDPEFPAQVLLNALYAKLHKALVVLGTQGIGVSFPKFNKWHLGDVLRLHGNATDLGALQALPWLGAMQNMVQTTALTLVPATAQHRSVRRVQTQSNPERVKRRLVKRLMTGKGGIANDAPYKAQIHELLSQPRLTEQCVADWMNNVMQIASVKVADPFIMLKSSSTGGQQFRLFIRHGPVQRHTEAGAFNAYGLSTTATVPWF